jgi:subtilisin family serine protease
MPSSVRRAVVAAATAAILAPCALPASAARHGDPLRHLQWGLDQIHAPQAWRVTRGAGVKIGVSDSGVDLTHPDLRGSLLPGKDFTGGNSTVDDCGHGTQVAGVIAASRDNGIGLSGVAPEAKILPLKDGASCGVNVGDTERAIRWAANHHVQVVNVSSGTLPVAGDALFEAFTRSTWNAAIDYAWRRGTLVIAGAGNSTIPLCARSATAPHLLCVGAVGRYGTRSSYSQGDATGTVDFLVAPGGDDASLPPNPDAPVDTDNNIWTTASRASIPEGDPSGYSAVNGTSFATPFVTGVAALLFSEGLSIRQVHDRLLHCTTDLGPPGRDPIYGYGEVNAQAAVTGRGCR